jgi:hypothetical protein
VKNWSFKEVTKCRDDPVKKWLIEEMICTKWPCEEMIFLKMDSISKLFCEEMKNKKLTLY